MVELTIALHRVFKHPAGPFRDGREPSGLRPQNCSPAGSIDSQRMRQFGGLNGFLCGPRATTIATARATRAPPSPLALGMAVGRDLRGGDEHIVAIAGDAAFTCGISYEALNNVRAQTKRSIVVLNDNEWSIAKNVGAIANYLNRIVTNRDLCAPARQGARSFVRSDLWQNRRPARAQSRGKRYKPGFAERHLSRNSACATTDRSMGTTFRC